jgi:hypothetical protein
MSIEDYSSLIQIVIAVTNIIVVYFISVLTHELGHFTAGKLLKYELSVFFVSPILYVNNGYVKPYVRVLSPKFITGMVLFNFSQVSSVTGYIKLRNDIKCISVMGCVFNFSGTVIALIIAQSTAAYTFPIIFALLNLIHIATSCLPGQDIDKIFDSIEYPEKITGFLINEIILNRKVSVFLYHKISENMVVILQNDINRNTLFWVEQIVKYEYVNNVNDGLTINYLSLLEDMMNREDIDSRVSEMIERTCRRISRYSNNNYTHNSNDDKELQINFIDSIYYNFPSYVKKMEILNL